VEPDFVKTAASVYNQSGFATLPPETLDMKVKLLAILLLVAARTSAQSGTQKPFVLGWVDTLVSRELGETRTLNIYLPGGFSPDSTYPVIYLLDGSADEDFIHISGLVQFANFPWINTLPPAIVVGIANVDRRRDFTWPTRVEQDKKNNPTSGKSATFIAFLEKELLPYIQTRYKTSDSKVLIGQSLGGLLATEILVKKTGLFSHYVIVSPSLWWDKESLLDLLSQKTNPTTRTTVWIGVGKEGKVMERDAKKLAALLRKSGNFRVGFRFFKKENHATVLHQAVYEAFHFLDLKK